MPESFRFSCAIFGLFPFSHNTMHFHWMNKSLSSIIFNFDSTNYLFNLFNWVLLDTKCIWIRQEIWLLAPCDSNCSHLHCTQVVRVIYLPRQPLNIRSMNSFVFILLPAVCILTWPYNNFRHSHNKLSLSISAFGQRSAKAYNKRCITQKLKWTDTSEIESEFWHLGGEREREQKLERYTGKELTYQWKYTNDFVSVQKSNFNIFIIMNKLNK